MYAIIACGIFQKEIEAINSELGFPFEAHYLGPGLHVDFEDLKYALRAELQKVQESGCEGIIVIYGQCHPKIGEILAPYRAALIECQSCVDAFITRKAMEKKANEGLFFDFTNLPFTVVPVDLNHFKSLIVKAKESLED